MAHMDHTYRIPGGRTGILLIHGPSETTTQMHLIANDLGRAGHTVLCPRLANHCGDEADLKAGTSQANTWQDRLTDCEAALDELRQSCDTVVVGGLSTGALLSLALATKHPGKVDGLALLAPVIQQIPWYARLFRAVVSKTIGTLEHSDLAEAVRSALPDITQPVLIVHPRQDGYAGLHNAWYLQNHLPGTVEMVVLDNSNHMMSVDTQRDVVVDRTVSFIDRVARKIAKPCQKRAPALAPAKSYAWRPSALQPVTA